MSRPYSARTRKIIELRAQGATIREIAVAVGVPAESIGSYMARLRKNGSIPRLTKEETVKRQRAARLKPDKAHCDPQLIIDLYKKNYPNRTLIATIASELNQSETYVSKVLKAYHQSKKDKVIALWQRGIILKTIAQLVGWTEAHVITFVYRLIKKGVLSHRGPANHYQRKRVIKDETTEGFTVFQLPKETKRSKVADETTEGFAVFQLPNRPTRLRCTRNPINYEIRVKPPAPRPERESVARVADKTFSLTEAKAQQRKAEMTLQLLILTTIPPVGMHEDQVFSMIEGYNREQFDAAIKGLKLRKQISRLDGVLRKKKL